MADDKAVHSVYREQPELGGSKEHTGNGLTTVYSGRGSEAEKKLILRQDLRIIPLCSFIYLLWYNSATFDRPVTLI